MSFSSSVNENSPVGDMSGVCVKLENQFTDDLSKAEAMRVFARIRPMLKSEIDAGYKECIGTIDEETIRAVVPSSSVRYKTASHISQDIIEDFKFTAAYGPEVGQFVFFEESMMNTMQNFIEGQNSLVFSYGITGSGKTFTLQGNSNYPGIIPLSLHLFFASIEDQLLDKIVVKPEKFDDVKMLNDNEIKKEYQLMGQLSSNNQEESNFRNSSGKSLAMLLCETFSDKFVSDGIETTLGPEEMAQAQAAALMKELSKKSAEQQPGYCSIWVSFAEIYNEYVYDLLQPNINQRTKLNLGEDKNGDIYIKGLTEVCVFNSFEALNLLNFGQRNLKIASTKLNYQSSRSHCIFTIKVVRILDPDNITHVKVNRLSFCDLAGSERASKSQTTGLRLKEAGCINTSLFVLGRCLEQLRLNPRDKKLIPFRESKLTRLFSGFFTGRGKAVMITNASPSEVTFDETLHALRFSAVATELIINDSYIATASSTLQSITNMWTNARANVSVSSDKSISFEDSTIEALQEKDELIEKLLDLAESLTSNLEKEKKEKAELEIKIRREVCQEYSEYSDELLERQKKTFEDECDSIREIYKKRIAAMEKMYENVIKSRESDSSCDEDEDAVCDAEGNMNSERKSTVSEKSFKEEIKEDIDMMTNDLKRNFASEGLIQDMEILKEDLQSLTEELKRTKEELEKSKDYCLALENATEEMEKKLEITNDNLEKALSENGELKIKIDYLQATYQDSASLKKEIEASAKCEREDLYEKFTESERNVVNLNAEIKVLIGRTNELIKSHEISKAKYEKSLEEVKKEAKDGEEVMKSVNQTLNSALAVTEEQKEKLILLESECASLKDKMADIRKEKESLEEKHASVSNELVLEKNKVKSGSSELKKLLEDNEKLTKELEIAENNCVQHQERAAVLHQTNLSLEEKLSVLKELESEKAFFREEIDRLNCQLKDALSAIEKQKTEIEKLLETNDSYKNQIAELQNSNKKLSEELSAQTSLNESEKMAYKKELDVANIKLSDALSNLDQQQKEIENLTNVIYLNETATSKLQKQIEELQNIRNSQIESEMSTYKKELDIVNDKLSNTLNDLHRQKMEVEDLKNIIDLNRAEKEEFQKQIQELHNKSKSQTESEVLAKKELEVKTQELSETVFALNKIKQEVERLTNVIDSEKLPLGSQKQDEELQKNMNSETDLEILDHKKELETVAYKLTEALSALDEQKRNVENLTSVIVSNEKEIAQLKQDGELQKNINSKIELENLTLKRELEVAVNKLSKTLSSLEEQKENLESLRSVIMAKEKEIEDLKNQNEDLQNIKSKTESENLAQKMELETALSKVSETLSTLEEQKENIENLKSLIKTKENDIENLQKQIEDLQITKSKTESEALSALNEQKQKVENLTSVVISCEKEIAELQKQNDEIKKEINSENGSKVINLEQDLHAANDKLNEALDTINKLNEELEIMLKEKSSAADKIADLFKIEEELKIKIDSQASRSDILYELIEKLEKCELLATENFNAAQSDLSKIKDEKMKLHEQLKEDASQHESKYNMIQKQFKELQASSKKQLQMEKQQFASEMSNIKTEKSNIERENKSLKFEIAQLKTEKDKLEIEVQHIKTKSEEMNENKNQLQKEKEKQEAELQFLRDQLEEVETNMLKKEKENLEAELKFLRDRFKDVETNVKETVEVGDKLTEVKETKKIKKEEEKSSAKRTLRRTKKETVEVENKFTEVKETKKIKNQNEKRKNKSNEKSKTASADKEPKVEVNKKEAIEKSSDKNAPKKVKDQEQKRKDKSKEKLESISEDKKPSIDIYEETDENSNNENMSKIKTHRRQLRSVENVSAGLGLVINKDTTKDAKSRGLKRKELNESFNVKLPVKNTLKKIRFQDSNETENISNNNKPENLRIKLLKANVQPNDIPMPSPRITRGRKRLGNLNSRGTISSTTGSPRTVRS